VGRQGQLRRDQSEGIVRPTGSVATSNAPVRRGVFVYWVPLRNVHRHGRVEDPARASEGLTSISSRKCQARANFVMFGREDLCGREFIAENSADGPRKTASAGNCSYCVSDQPKLKTPKGKMQSPLETPVQALRNTRLVEEVCAWTTVNVQFPHITFTRGSAPKRHPSLSTCVGTLTLPPPIRLFLMRFIALPMMWITGPPGQWAPEGVDEQRLHVGSSTHFLRVLSCRIGHVRGLGRKRSRRNNEHRHRHKRDWSPASRIRLATIRRWQTRAVDGGP
jgi:hypothetical protein